MRIVLMSCAALALVACTAQQPRTVSYGNDALPSAEVTAFKAADARLRYRDARIAYDDANCAVYEGRTADGTVMREPLLDAGGRTICRPR